MKKWVGRVVEVELLLGSNDHHDEISIVRGTLVSVSQKDFELTDCIECPDWRGGDESFNFSQNEAQIVNRGGKSFSRMFLHETTPDQHREYRFQIQDTRPNVR